MSGSLKRIEKPADIYYKTPPMKPNELRNRLGGVISFPCTPFKKDLSLDLDGLRKKFALAVKHPICAIVAPAGTGEIHSLSPAEHLAVVKTTVEEVNGKVPVLTGTGFNAADCRGTGKAGGSCRRGTASSHFRRIIRARTTKDYRLLSRHCGGDAARHVDLQSRLVCSATGARGKTGATNSEPSSRGKTDRRTSAVIK